MLVRVQVTDVWDTVEVSAPQDHTFADLKAASLEQAMGRLVDPALFFLVQTLNFIKPGSRKEIEIIH